MGNILEIKNLSTSFFTKKGEIRAVNGVSFSLSPGKTLAIVGESGSGKSIAVLSVMGLIPKPGKVIGGEILFNGEDLATKDHKQMMKIRGKMISMIFQEPMTSLNPVYTCGNQVIEAIRLHEKCTNREARERTIRLFELVGISDALRHIGEYPDQLSGGMRQRVMIAMALACSPEILIADEPTTALDVTIQAQILELLKSLQKKLGMGIILITHDMGVVAEMADMVNVMYAGRIAEKGTAEDIFVNPAHPYTIGLLKSIPTLEGKGKIHGERLHTIRGTVPDLLRPPEGCAFAPRCDMACERCTGEIPQMTLLDGEHYVSCFAVGKKAGE